MEVSQSLPISKRQKFYFALVFSCTTCKGYRPEKERKDAVDILILIPFVSFLVSYCTQKMDSLVVVMAVAQGKQKEKGDCLVSRLLQDSSWKELKGFMTWIIFREKEWTRHIRHDNWDWDWDDYVMILHFPVVSQIWTDSRLSPVIIRQWQT